MTVVVHSFVADSSLLDCCDLVVFLFVPPPPTLCLQVGNRWEFWGGFSCLFLSSGVSCLLAWLGQPFFVCHQHLWFGLSFFVTGISGLFFLSLPQAFVYILFLSRPFLPYAFVLDCDCCSSAASRVLGDSNWNCFQVGYLVDTPTNCALKQTPFGIPP